MRQCKCWGSELQSLRLPQTLSGCTEALAIIWRRVGQVAVHCAVVLREPTGAKEP
ncbi:unnamed protein product [Symbiodinium sp. CCMP2592]|nr:unnamed protein product [Symbiodinium sp. CCMP2592]